VDECVVQAVLADWAWRPNLKRFTDHMTDPLYFVPSAVHFRLNLVDTFKLGLILNDENIVNDFADGARNTVRPHVPLVGAAGLGLHAFHLYIVHWNCYPVSQDCARLRCLQYLMWR
jgi:hypothetical protein